jgi:hypothetical protein
VFFTINSQIVEWSAVSMPQSTLEFTALKTINGIAPLNNNFIIEESGILKIRPDVEGINIGLLGNAAEKVTPQLIYE